MNSLSWRAGTVSDPLGPAPRCHVALAQRRPRSGTSGFQGRRRDKVALEGLVVHYSYLNRAYQERRNMSPEAVERYKQQLPPRDRPVVWAHRTGRTSMLLGSTAGEVIGWPLDDGEAFLERLLEWSTQPRFTMHLHRERGDLVLWDNTGILHRALPYGPESGRLMHRTTIEGVEPVL